MFTGLDFRGWKTNSAALERWRAAGGHLGLRSEMPSAESTLWNEQDFGDAEFILDCSPGKAKDDKETSPPAVLVRGAEVKLAGAEPGKYRRFVITVKGLDLTLKRDDKEVQRLTLPADAPARGAFGLRDTGNAVDFMNLYVRHL